MNTLNGLGIAQFPIVQFEIIGEITNLEAIAAGDDCLRVIDESGEDYLMLPSALFPSICRSERRSP
jgi:hypothetical protein